MLIVFNGNILFLIYLFLFSIQICNKSHINIFVIIEFKIEDMELLKFIGWFFMNRASNDLVLF